MRSRPPSHRRLRCRGSPPLKSRAMSIRLRPAPRRCQPTSAVSPRRRARPDPPPWRFSARRRTLASNRKPCAPRLTTSSPGSAPPERDQARHLMPLEILHLALVLFRRRARFEGAEIAPPPGLRIHFAGIEPVLARTYFADHGTRASFSIHCINRDRRALVPTSSSFRDGPKDQTSDVQLHIWES